MIMKTIVTIFTFSVILCLFASCYSNSIYFDIEKQSVVRCKGTISKLYIISKDNKDYLCFLILSNKKEKASFSIKELDKDYSINVTNTVINLQKFKLRPEMEYEIINYSNGDTPHGKITIKTDKNSFVIYADKTSCE